MTKRTLVTCFSRDGATAKVAAHLADILHADVDRIQESAPRNGVSGYVRSALEALARGLPAIHTERNPAEYDLVVVGTPVWVGTMSSPVRSYLYLHRQHLHDVAFFAVMGGRGGNETLAEMRVASGFPNARGRTFTQREVERGAYVGRASLFAASIEERLKDARPSMEPVREPLDFRPLPVGT
ncbi:MAG TPA: hypothetical protein VHE30_12510 [Polyangiaceae bacterium]|nr:hypothetical protein [Polyangiaceae bacterium]